MSAPLGHASIRAGRATLGRRCGGRRVFAAVITLRLHVCRDHLHLFLVFTEHAEQVIASPYEMDGVGDGTTGAWRRRLIGYLAFFEVEPAS